jgi:hypothetical protein
MNRRSGAASEARKYRRPKPSDPDVPQRSVSHPGPTTPRALFRVDGLAGDALQSGLRRVINIFGVLVARMTLLATDESGMSTVE